MNSKEKLENILSEVAISMKDMFGEKLKWIKLYGSYARGDYDNGSDIDIMVLVDMDKYELANYRDVISDIACEIGLMQNDVLLSIKLQDSSTFNKWNKDLPYFENVLKEGITINA
jgi:uncharacterized protein